MSEHRRRALLLGVGQMGRNHLRVLGQSDDFDLVAAVDPHIPAPSAQVLGSVRFVRALDEVDLANIDVAVVATPTPLHFDHVERLLAADIHVLVEKPMAGTLEQARALAELARERGLQLMVGHLERLNPAVRKLKEVIDSGWLGQPIHFDITRVGGYPEHVVDGENVLFDLAVHDIDVLNALVGRMEVRASVCHSTLSSGVLDTAEILLQDPGRSTSASIHVNWITPTKIRTLRVTGTKGVCSVDYMLQTCELLGGDLLRRDYPGQVGAEFSDFVRTYQSSDRLAFGVNVREPLLVQLEQMVRQLDGEPSDNCSVEDAIYALEIADAAIRSDAHRAD